MNEWENFILQEVLIEVLRHLTENVMLGLNCADLILVERWYSLKSDMIIVEKAHKFLAISKLNVCADDFMSAH